MVVQKNASILVVDFELNVRENALGYLRDEGFHVMATESSESALRLASRLSFDLIVADVLLPGINGKELAGKISALQPRVKVLFTSFYSRSALLHEDMSFMGSALIAKPFTKAQLLGKVNMVLAFHRPWKDLKGFFRGPAGGEEDVLVPLRNEFIDDGELADPATPL